LKNKGKAVSLNYSRQYLNILYMEALLAMSMGILILRLIAVWIFPLVNLQKTLDAYSQENRATETGLVFMIIYWSKTSGCRKTLSS